MRNDLFNFGWLSPSGEFFPCSRLGHLSCATKLVHTYHFKTGNPDDILLSAGYIKVSGSLLFAQRFISDQQATWLEDHNFSTHEVQIILPSHPSDLIPNIQGV